jgi:hypothetical protein
MRKILFITFLSFSFFSEAQVVAEKDTLESRAAIPIDISDYNSNALKFTAGIRGGISKTRINTSSGDVIQITPNGTPVVNGSGVVRDELVSSAAFGNGYQGAIFARITSGSFYIQPEVIYGTKGGKFDFLDQNGNLLNRVDAKFSAIDIPVLIGMRFRDARIFLGPVISYALKKNSQLSTGLKPYTNENLSKDFFKRPVVNTMLGLGFEFKSFFFDLRYEAGVSNYAETTLGPLNNPKTFSFTTDQFILSIGILK